MYAIIETGRRKESGWMSVEPGSEAQDQQIVDANAP